MTRVAELKRFFERHKAVVRATLTRVRGSSPREAGAEMYVAPDAIYGTVGGGQLEYLAIGRARELLDAYGSETTMDVPLGPEIGQCCGGRVELTLARLDETAQAAALDRVSAAEQALPHVLVLGAGHVGRALANLFQHLPVRTAVIDMREQELALCTADVETRLSAIAEQDIMNAPRGSAFIVATHDHGLDFLLTSAALQRGDAAYVGLIGSDSKRVQFERWCRESRDGVATESLTCPIGTGGSADKRPSIIAAMVAAEVMTALTTTSRNRAEPKDDEPASAIAMAARRP